MVFGASIMSTGWRKRGGGSVFDCTGYKDNDQSTGCCHGAEHECLAVCQRTARTATRAHDDGRLESAREKNGTRRGLVTTILTQFVMRLCFHPCVPLSPLFFNFFYPFLGKRTRSFCFRRGEFFGGSSRVI